MLRHTEIDIAQMISTALPTMRKNKLNILNVHQ